jgi:hypothetical protein
MDKKILTSLYKHYHLISFDQNYLYQYWPIKRKIGNKMLNR